MDIAYIPSTRARSVRITVERDGSVRVSYPHRLERYRVESWVATRHEWIMRAQKKMLSRRGIALPTGTEGRTLFVKNKKRARSIVESYLSIYQKDFVWKKVRIVNARTRWGSCSTNGTLSFNWRIVYLDAAVQQYLIVHEICHLKHHNHSNRFWAEVELMLPGYKQLRDQLKGYHF